MRVGRSGQFQGVTSRKNGGSVAKGEGFSVGSGSESRAPTPSASTKQVQSVDAILSIQGVDDAVTGRRSALRHGHKMLDVLDDLRIGLLSGKVPPGKLKSLVTLVDARAPSGDEELEDVLDAIELRARVELAKLEQLGR